LSRLIRQELGEERVECETVDSYQGQENLFCLMSYFLPVLLKEKLSRLIRQELGEERVEFETVDSYQGQENHVIILSLGLAVCREEALSSFYTLFILWTIPCR
jgi:hypothetical protein